MIAFALRDNVDAQLFTMYSSGGVQANKIPDFSEDTASTKIMTLSNTGIFGWIAKDNLLPSGTLHQTLRHDGEKYVSTSGLLSDGTNVEIGEAGAYRQDGEQVIRIEKGTETFHANTYAGRAAGSGTQHQSAFGYSAGFSNTGDRQSAFGSMAGRDNTGAKQSSFGYNAGYLNTGANQSAFGYLAGRDNSGDNQSAFGFYAGYQNAGDHQSAFGYNAGYLNEGNNCIQIGYAAGQGNTTDNLFLVEQRNINATPLLIGNLLTGKLGIGIVPEQTLDVNGAIRIGTTTDAIQGSIRYTGTDFQGYVADDGSGSPGWVSLTE